MNSSIENDHIEIKRLFESLSDKLRDHFDREQKIFEIRKMMIPQTHIEIERFLVDHQRIHQDLFDSLQSLLERFETHILNEDIPHFHPLKERMRIKSKL